MKTKLLFFIGLIFIFSGSLPSAFAITDNSKNLNNIEITGNFMSVAQSDSPKADLDEFPNLHPLVVHFPIALLLLALVFQLIQLFVMNRTMDWVILLTVGAGFIGAYVASNFVHPHTEGLTETAKKVLEQHDKYAMWTMWSSAAAAILKLGSLFLLKQKRWFEVLVFLVLAFSGYSVGWAGHYGSQLVYIEGVGPQGKYLGNESEEGHEKTGEHSH